MKTITLPGIARGTLEIIMLVVIGVALYALHRLSGYWRWHQYRKAILRND